MITGELKNKIDSLWEIFWTGGLTNPLDVIEQMTYLMFIHDLDATDNTRAMESAMLGIPYTSIFTGEVRIGDRTIDGTQLKWSVFHDFPAARMYSVVQEWVFPFIKGLHSDKEDLVQIEVERRKALGKHYSGGGAFASRVMCGDCGGFYGAKVWHSTDPYRTIIWRCNGKYEGEKCTCPHIREDELIRRFMSVLGKVLARKTVVLSACQESINAILGVEDDKLEKLRDQANELAEKVRSLISLRAQVGTEQKAFEREYKRVTSQYERIVGKIEGLEKEKSDRERRAKRIELFMSALEKQEEGLEFDAVLVSVFLEKVLVSGTKKDVRVRFVLTDGSEWDG